MKQKRIPLGMFLVSVLLVIIYYSTFIWLYERFSAADSYYSHGFLVPFICGFLIWQKKDKLRNMKADSSISGLILLILGLVMQVLSVVLGVYLISEVSLMLVLFGLVLYLFGSKIKNEVALALLFMLFMFPIPMFLINYITFPLRMLVTTTAVFSLEKLGLPVMRNGFEIIFPDSSLVVGTPCSGLRSQISFIALSYLFAYFLNTDMKRRVFLFAMAAPVAIFTNFLRIMSLSLVAFVYGEAPATEGFFHDFSGIMVFVIGFALLAGLRSALECHDLKENI